MLSSSATSAHLVRLRNDHPCVATVLSLLPSQIIHEVVQSLPVRLWKWEEPQEWELDQLQGMLSEAEWEGLSLNPKACFSCAFGLWVWVPCCHISAKEVTESLQPAEVKRRSRLSSFPWRVFLGCIGSPFIGNNEKLHEVLKIALTLVTSHRVT